MVKRGLFLLLLIIPFLANAITAEELRRIAGDADRAKRERDHRIKATDLTSLLPKLQAEDKAPIETMPISKSEQSSASDIVVQPANPSDEIQVVEPKRVRTEDAPRSTKYGEDNSTIKPDPGSGGINVNVKARKSTQIPATPDYVYVPPARYKSSGNSGSSSNSDVVAVKQRKFGIRIGAWFAGYMSRETTNSDPGLIEIRITEDVNGDFRALPAGTLLFANKRYNPGTKRLDLKIVQGVLPSGEEIELDGLVYDLSRMAGLPGIVVENNTGIASTGFKKGVIDAGRSIASTVAGESVAGIVLDSTVNAVVTGKQAATSAAEVAAYTVHVSPQAVLMQVQVTF